MEQSVLLPNGFDLAEILHGVFTRRPCQEDTTVVIPEIMLNRFADGDDMGLKMTARPQIEPPRIGGLNFIKLQAELAMKIGGEIVKTEDALTQEVKVVLTKGAQGFLPLVAR